MTDDSPVILATIGYEGAALRDFIETLRGVGVTTLMDVREAPYSKREEFRKNELERALVEAGIRYIHVHGFGAPREGREAAKAGQKHGYVQAFAKHLQSKVFQDALVTNSEVVKEGNTCLMCLERDPKRCHRRIVASVLADVTGVQIKHLTVQKAGQFALPLND